MNMILLLRRFPVQVALAALFVYTLTLSQGITLASLPLTAKVAGWDWQPLNTQPLLWLLTLPLRFLPAGWVAPGLNFFSAVCGALTLGVLARSLELLSWDRPLETLPGWQAKLPILLGCGICGLEFSFWQEATAATGEMLQSLLFATAILCLLEYRVARNFRWMQAATFVWGLGMAENWMMVLTLPLFALSLFWLGKFELLKRELLVRLALTGLAGFSIFAFLPLVNGLSPHSPWGFGEAWLNTLKNYKNILLNIRGEFWQAHRVTTIGVIVFFLVPVLPAVVRLRDEGTQHKSGVDQFQVWIYRSLRAALLLACLWLVFDPVVGPRQLVFKQMGLSLPLLSLDYLIGLGGGFLAGNLLLALRVKEKENYRRPNFLEIYSERAAIPAFVALLVIVTTGLLFRNASAITLANRQPLAQFGDLAFHSLPPGGGIMLSDEPQHLRVFQAAAAARGESSQWLALDTVSLKLAAYRRQLARQYPGDWLTNLGRDNLKPADMLKLVVGLTQTNRVYYLHPSYGYFFEVKYLQVAGMVYALRAYADQSVSPPPPTAEMIAQTEKFWDAAAPRLVAIEQTVSPEKTGIARAMDKIYARFHLQAVPLTQSRLLGEWYSMSLDDWGVRLQRAGRLVAAKNRFAQALALNPGNPAGLINGECNSNLIAGLNLNLAAVDTLAQQFGTYQHLSRFTMQFGPVDEPSFCYLMGNAYQQMGLLRLALQQFERAHALAPDILAPQIVLAELYARCGRNEQARELISKARGRLPPFAEKNSLDLGLSLLEANTWLTQTNSAKARSVLRSMLNEHPDDPRTVNLVMNAYLAFGDYTNALQLVNRQLSADPDNLSALLNQANIYNRFRQFTPALASLDRALALSNCPPIQLARANTRVEAGQYDLAETDYLELKKNATNNLPIYYGLAEIASRRQETNRAIEYLERCLAELPPEDSQRDRIFARIKALKLARPSS